MGDDEKIPSISEVIADIAPNVSIMSIFSGEEITRPRIVATIQKCISDCTGELASNEDT